ncbi:uncharacterized protein LOC125178708 [Hyalella azteca]|uniref:Uncharacterized protein LOC125178708 n=1 Tax=Hyalella azteca TaxID=294128 RepID=A0A979FQZ0_HYAAZ|nr:uncharacterized protein LOC125178708 [Hyalella azteca]
MAARTFGVGGLQPGERYEIRVTAYNSAGATPALYTVTTAALYSADEQQMLGRGDGFWTPPQDSSRAMSSSDARWSNPRLIVPLILSASTLLLTSFSLCYFYHKRRSFNGRADHISGDKNKCNPDDQFIQHPNEENKFNPLTENVYHYVTTGYPFSQHDTDGHEVIDRGRISPSQRHNSAAYKSAEHESIALKLAESQTTEHGITALNCAEYKYAEQVNTALNSARYPPAEQSGIALTQRPTSEENRTFSSIHFHSSSLHEVDDASLTSAYTELGTIPAEDTKFVSVSDRKLGQAGPGIHQHQRTQQNLAQVCHKPLTVLQKPGNVTSRPRQKHQRFKHEEREDVSPYPLDRSMTSFH